MRIEFLNHASLLLEAGDARIVMDPWFEGSAFNDGWDLVAPTAFATSDWSRVTHIWYSHEHPDHFSPRTLRAIPEPTRKHITVLYQKSADGKIVEFCRKLGFGEVRELVRGEWLSLAPGVELRCDPFTSGDSWLAVRTPAHGFLNLNDCGIRSAQEVAAIGAEVGRVDVLATQFSISSWDGNPEEGARLRAGAASMLEKMVCQVHGLEPRFVIPFASFVRFSHEENQFLNAFHNSVEQAVATLEGKTTARAIAMFPGDRWSVGDAHDNASALARWSAAYRDATAAPLHRSRPRTLEQLSEAARAWVTRLDALGSRTRLRVALARLRFLRAPGSSLERLLKLIALAPPLARVWLDDLARAVEISYPAGLAACASPRDACDVSMSTDSLGFALENLFGGESLLVNARFRELRPDGRKELFGYFELASGVNQGLRLSWASAARRALRILTGRG